MGNKQILTNVSLSVENVGVTALMGMSGVGKTSLLNIIAGLLKPDCGNIESNFKRISVKFQEPRLFEWLTVKENVLAVLDNTPHANQTAEKHLEDVGLSEDMNKYPKELSGGMAQRVALARAIAYNGDLLLLDEPFATIDENTKSLLLPLIRSYAQTHAVIFVTHNVQEAHALNANIFYL